MTAADLMRRDVTIVPARMTVAAYTTKYPVGSVKHVAATDANGAFVGIVDVARIYLDAPSRERLVADILVHRDAWIAATASIDRIVPIFEEQSSESLIVVSSPETRRIEGLVTEAFVLRRYRLELESRQREIFGTGAP